MTSVVGANFLVPNSSFVVEVIAFLLVLAVLAKYVLPRLNSAMEERQKTIQQGQEEAEKAKERAAAAETEYRQAIDKARAEARSLVEEANKAGEAIRADWRQRAEAEYERIVSRAQADIDASARRASEELRQDLSETVIVVVRKVIGEALDVEAHRQLIDRTISEVESEAGVQSEVRS